MRTAKSLLISAFLLAFALVTNFQAVTLDPADYMPVAGETKTFMILADPPVTGTIGIQLRLKVDNATIIDYAPPESQEDLLILAACADNAYFTTTEVCTDFTTSTNFTPGQTLGTLTVLFAEGQSNITKTESNAYLDSTFELINDSSILVGEVAEPTATIAPTSTETSDLNALNTVMAVLLITIGLVLISVAIVLIAKHTKSKHETHQNN